MLFVSIVVEDLYDTLHAARCLSDKSDKFLLEFYFGLIHDLTNS